MNHRQDADATKPLPLFIHVLREATDDLRLISFGICEPPCSSRVGTNSPIRVVLGIAH
jgi:hypothetical protein